MFPRQPLCTTEGNFHPHRPTALCSQSKASCEDLLFPHALTESKTCSLPEEVALCVQGSQGRRSAGRALKDQCLGGTALGRGSWGAGLNSYLPAPPQLSALRGEAQKEERTRILLQLGDCKMTQTCPSPGGSQPGVPLPSPVPLSSEHLHPKNLPGASVELPPLFADAARPGELAGSVLPGRMDSGWLTPREARSSGAAALRCGSLPTRGSHQFSRQGRVVLRVTITLAQAHVLPLANKQRKHQVHLSSAPSSAEKDGTRSTLPEQHSATSGCQQGTRVMINTCREESCDNIL